MQILKPAVSDSGVQSDLIGSPRLIMNHQGRWALASTFASTHRQQGIDANSKISDLMLCMVCGRGNMRGTLACSMLLEFRIYSTVQTGTEYEAIPYSSQNRGKIQAEEKSSKSTGTEI